MDADENIILVTGGGGFLGSYIVDELLKRGYKVRSFSRGHYEHLEQKGVQCHRGSLTNFKEVLDAIKGVKAVIHTAALAGIWGKWEEYYDTNYLGTKNIIDACRVANVKNLIYTSSPSVVFDGKDISGEGEEIPYAKKHWCHYPVTKKIAEDLVLASNSSELRTSALRPHLIWGPKDPHFMPRLVARAQSGRLKQIGDGSNMVDVIYVENAAKAHVDLLEKMNAESSNVAGKAYFIGQEKPVKLWDFVNRLISSAGGPVVKRKIPLWLGYALGSVMEGFFRFFRIYSREPVLTRFLALQMGRSHYFNHTKAVKDFDYKVYVSTDEGFRRLKESFSAKA